MNKKQFNQMVEVAERIENKGEKRMEKIIQIIEDLEYELDCKIYFDDSRSWSLYTQDEKYTKGNVNKVGAFRNYLGGGVRGELQHNGDKEHRTLTVGKKLYKALAKIEKIYNEDYEHCEACEQPSGILL